MTSRNCSRATSQLNWKKFENKIYDVVPAGEVNTSFSKLMRSDHKLIAKDLGPRSFRQNLNNIAERLELMVHSPFNIETPFGTRKFQ